MDELSRGQVNRKAAEIYEEFFVPALFQEWPIRVVDAARIQRGERVLDVACGTGILARKVAERIGDAGTIVGLDINDGMLAVASRQAPQIEWRQGKAESLPFDSGSFDAVVSQFGLMFFEDRQAAVHEMVRVLKPGGRLAVAVWDSLDNIPGYAAMVKLLQKLFGDQVADGLRAPFALGDAQALQPLFHAADLRQIEITTPQGTARFPTLETWVYTDIKGWALADMINDAEFELLLKEAKPALSQFVTSDGRVCFNAPAHIVSAVKA